MSGRRFGLALLALASIGFLPPAHHAVFGADQTPQQQIESRLMCYCGCSDLTVRTCTCGVAASIRDEIAERLGRGETSEQVVAAFIARYGEKILSAPTKQGFNLVAWVAPIVAFFVAAVAIVFLVRRWGRPHGAGAGARRGGSATGGPPPATLTEEERILLGRIEREIREGH